LETTPLVSIVIPTLNRYEYLKETIASILAQTYSNFELIIVSDNSTDETAAVINYISDKRCHLYTLNIKSNGPAFVRNFGITKCNGELIAFCDDDDIWMPDKLEKQVEIMMSNNEIALIGTNVKYFGDVQRAFKYSAILKNFLNRMPFIPKKYLLTFYNCIVISSAMVRKSVLNEMRFNEMDEYHGHEDLDLWLKICIKHKVLVIPQYLIYYRVHSAQLSNPIDKAYKKQSLNILKKNSAELNFIQKRIVDLRLFIYQIIGY
jgi:glycosyltransferase involved in cell wall biosynthesis